MSSDLWLVNYDTVLDTSYTFRTFCAISQYAQNWLSFVFWNSSTMRMIKLPLIKQNHDFNFFSIGGPYYNLRKNSWFSWKFTVKKIDISKSMKPWTKSFCVINLDIKMQLCTQDFLIWAIICWDVYLFNNFHSFFTLFKNSGIFA